MVESLQGANRDLVFAIIGPVKADSRTSGDKLGMSALRGAEWPGIGVFGGSKGGPSSLSG